MEPDALKAVWRDLDEHLAQHNRIHLELYKDRKLEKARTSLRPLFWGQLMQMLFGLSFIALAASLWIHGTELSGSVLVAGILVHAYGIAVTAISGMMLGRITSIDYAAPVVSIQQQLARLRRFYIISSMVAGLPWWLLWVAILMVLLGLGGIDLFAKAPSVIWIAFGIGIPGLLGTWWFYRWSCNPKRSKLAKAVEDSLTGGSLRKAQRVVDEIEQFRHE